MENENTDINIKEKQINNILKHDIALYIPGLILLVFGIIIATPLALFTMGQWTQYNYIDKDNIVGLSVLAIMPIAGLCCIVYEIIRKNKTKE